jgi:hypothetical protein
MLEFGADAAAIVTLALAVSGYGWYRWERRQKRVRLERHLREEIDLDPCRSCRSLPELVAQLGMSETDILDASFRSRHIRRSASPNMQGNPPQVLLEWTSGSEDADWRLKNGGRPL